MFFNSVKEINSIRKKKRLLSKGMSNVYLKATIEKNWGSQDFLSLKQSSPGKFWGAPTHKVFVEF